MAWTSFAQGILIGGYLLEDLMCNKFVDGHVSLH